MPAPNTSTRSAIQALHEEDKVADVSCVGEKLLNTVHYFLFLLFLMKKKSIQNQDKQTPHTVLQKLRGKKVNTKSRQTNTSHCPTKTISKTATAPLKMCHPANISNCPKH